MPYLCTRFREKTSVWTAEAYKEKSSLKGLHRQRKVVREASLIAPLVRNNRSLAFGMGTGKGYFTMKSLILAQDER